MRNSLFFFFLFGISCPIMSRFIFSCLISSVTEWEMAAKWLNKRRLIKRKKLIGTVGKQESQVWGLYQSSVEPSCSHNTAALIPSNMFHIYEQESAGCWMRPLLSGDLRSPQLADNSRFLWDEHAKESEAAHTGTARISKCPRGVISDFQCWQTKRSHLCPETHATY